MSDISVSIHLIKKLQTRGGFVSTELRELVSEFDYVRRGPITGGGQFMDAHIPAEKFEELCADLKGLCRVVNKSDFKPVIS